MSNHRNSTPPPQTTLTMQTRVGAITITSTVTATDLTYTPTERATMAHTSLKAAIEVARRGHTAQTYETKPGIRLITTAEATPLDFAGRNLDPEEAA